MCSDAIFNSGLKIIKMGADLAHFNKLVTNVICFANFAMFQQRTLTYVRFHTLSFLLAASHVASVTEGWPEECRSAL